MSEPTLNNASVSRFSTMSNTENIVSAKIMSTIVHVNVTAVVSVRYSKNAVYMKRMLVMERRRKRWRTCSTRVSSVR